MTTTPPLPAGPFTTICADPPWPYNTTVKGTSALQKPLEGRGALLKSDGTMSKGVQDFTYGVMSMDDICNLNVQAIIGPNAHLYLWTTNAFMREAYDVAASWGFTPKTIITWGKIKKGTEDDPVPSMKSGYYFRGATEHVLFATRGSLPKPTKALPTLMLHPRIAQHSAKPEVFYDAVEEVSPGPYLEMFARTARPGWSVWGAQAPDGAA